MKNFWDPFIKKVEDIDENVSRADVAQSRDVGIDKESGKPITVRMGPMAHLPKLVTRTTKKSLVLPA